jgi:transposase-like protein
MDDDLARFLCHNPKCPDFGKHDAKNLSVCDRYGPDNKRRMLYCSSCKARFSERKGTVFFDSRLSEEQATSILEHVGEGCGVRKTARLVRVNRTTVSRYSKLAGQHAKKTHEDRVAFSPADP